MTVTASNMGKACANMLTLLSFVSVTRSQLFGYDCMSNPDVFSCEPGPIMNQWKVHFTSASFCNAFLLYYFIELRSWLVEISFHTYSLSPRAVWLSLSGAHIQVRLIHLHWYVAHTDSLSGAVGSMRTSHVIMLWSTNLLFVLVHNEVCLVNENGRSVIDAQRENAQHTKTLVRLRPFERTVLCMPVTFSTCLSLCLCQRIWDVDKEFKECLDV